MKLGKLLVGGVAATAIIMGLTGAFDEEPVKQEAVTIYPPEEVEAAETEEPEAEEVAQEETEDLALSPEMIFTMLEDNFEGTARIEYDDSGKTFMIYPTDQALIEELLLVMSGSMSKDSWDGMVDSFEYMSASIGPDYFVALANPANDENYLLLLNDGATVYDALNE